MFNAWPRHSERHEPRQRTVTPPPKITPLRHLLIKISYLLFSPLISADISPVTPQSRVKGLQVILLTPGRCRFPGKQPEKLEPFRK